MRELLPLFKRLEASGEAVAVALVVATAGSTYRKAGAAMLLSATGLTEGAVSGGCLEADLLARVQGSVLPLGRPERVQYDTTATDEEVWGLNLGCNGLVEVLLAPAPGGVLAAAASELEERRRVGLLWGASGAPLGRCWLLTEKGFGPSVTAEAGPPVGNVDDGSAVTPALAPQPPARLLPEAEAYLWAGKHALLHHEGAEYFLQVLLPAPRLLLFGAGAEGPPLARGARELGWSVTVIDHRPALLHPARWPEGTQRCEVPPERAVAAADPQPDDFCIIMTHHFERDRLLLDGLLARAPLRRSDSCGAHITRSSESAPRYIGILGPRARTNLLLSGRTLHPEEAGRIASPLGIDLGGEGPAAIALSALAELEAVRWGRSGGRLTDRHGLVASAEEVKEDATERHLPL